MFFHMADTNKALFLITNLFELKKLGFFSFLCQKSLKNGQKRQSQKNKKCIVSRKISYLEQENSFRPIQWASDTRMIDEQNGVSEKFKLIRLDTPRRGDFFRSHKNRFFVIKLSFRHQGKFFWSKQRLQSISCMEIPLYNWL